MSAVLAPAELFSLRGRRAAVLGGTGVLGSRFCCALAAAGAEVVVLGRSRERGDAVVDAVRAAGGAASFRELDATDDVALAEAAAAIGAEGGLDVLVNAPGRNSSTPFLEIGRAEWDELLDVNLSSVFRVCQAFTPHLAGRPDGAVIINISSASSGPPLTRVVTYAVAKAGVDNLTRYLAKELAPDGIRVNAIRPGFFPAEQNRALLTEERVGSILGHTPLGRLGEPHELDGALLWLASPLAAGFVTGAIIPVDGGFSAMTI